MTKSEMQLVFAHAVAVGMVMNSHTLDGNVSSQDVGKLVYTRAKGMMEGYLETLREDQPRSRYHDIPDEAPEPENDDD